jgi:hypothetical protein
MPTYLVESYAQSTDASHAAMTASLARAAAELVREGVLIEHRRTTFLPDDETCFYLFETDSAAAVEEVCRRARLGGIRIVAAIEEPTGANDTQSQA